MAKLGLLDLEAILTRLRQAGVVRLDLAEAPKASRVQVVTSDARPKLEIANDVRKLLDATFGIELKKKQVSVTRLTGDSHARPSCAEEELAASGTARDARPAERPRLDAVAVELAGLGAKVQVTLSVDGHGTIGSTRGSSSGIVLQRLVAEAALDALRQLDATASTLHVDDATTVRVGSSDLAAVTVVDLMRPSQPMLSGSAPIRVTGSAEATARALLDATNRRSHFGRRTPLPGLEAPPSALPSPSPPPPPPPPPPTAFPRPPSAIA